MTSFWDWVGRVVMLVLAGMITLSIISAIAAIPSGSLPETLRLERQSWPEAQPRSEPVPPSSRPSFPEPEPATSPEATAARENVVAAQAPQSVADPREWLEAIAYALLALVGIAAFATLLLWRAFGQWRRSADALEAIAARLAPKP